MTTGSPALSLDIQRLVQHLSVGVMVHGPDATILLANQEAARLFGLPLEQVMGKSPADLLWHLVCEDGTTLPSIEYPGIRPIKSLRPVENFVMGIEPGPTGQRLWVLVHADPEFNEQQQLQHVVVTFKDITGLKKTEEKLQDSLLKVDSAQLVAKIGFWNIDPGNMHLEWSSGLKSIFELPPDSPAPSYDEWWSCLFPDDREFVSAQVAKQMQPLSEPTISYVYRIITKAGHIKHLEHIGRQLLNAEGQLIKLYGAVQDITEQKKAVEEREKLQAQLNQAQKMEAIGQLAGGLAHDFNNILSVILGNSEVALLKIDSDHPLFSHLQEIRKAAERSGNLTRQLLAFARKQNIAPKILDLNETVEGILRMLQRLIGENIDLVWHPCKDLWSIKIDPSQIDQILANLCVNARDAIAGVGTITIETANVTFDSVQCFTRAEFSPGDYVALIVSDNGCGMDKETQAKIFEPFFTTKGIGQGTGLGLATVYGIIKQNQCLINVYSEVGKGTVFKIYLPRQTGSAVPIKRSLVSEDIPRGMETILLVEDEPTLLDLSRNILQRLGYTVLTATTPGEAIYHAQTCPGPIHLLMTDVIMPEMNGLELSRRLLSINPRLKCLFMSGYTANVIAHQGVLEEGVFFIQKPFFIKELALKIRETLAG